MAFKKAEFVVSNSDYRKCPDPDRPEFAFIGRSNVGKSSLINLLTGRKALAKVSGTPGKTQLINHFLINDSFYLVDLPGYGYAKVSKTEKKKWESMIGDYLLKRANLSCLFVLLDARLEPQKIDLEFTTWMGENGVPLALVFTKSDKLTRNQLHISLTRYEQTLLEQWEELPPRFVTSSTAGTGQAELCDYLIGLSKIWS
ncbi:MAG: YihA family ribosome biogenesis GTP-binding protein [Cytophagales bacterium]|nr:YihA family ribosome biogenesis GTP-binding protein [Cytophagales bacterium]